MDYVLFNVPEEAADDLAERLLGVIASVAADESPGFSTSVDTSLLTGLNFLESHRQGMAENIPFCLVRLYEAGDPLGSRILIAGEGLSFILPGIVEVLRKVGLNAQKQFPSGLPPATRGGLFSVWLSPVGSCFSTRRRNPLKNRIMTGM